MRLCAKLILFACVSVFMASGIVSHPANASSAVADGNGKIHYFNEDSVTWDVTNEKFVSDGRDVTAIVPYVKPLFDAMDAGGDMSELSTLIEGLVQALVGLGLVVLVGSAILRALRMIM